MPDTSYSRKNKRPVPGSCTLPLPKLDENTTRLARRYAQVFSQALKKKQCVVLCNVSPPLEQAITLGAWIAGNPLACLNPAYTKIQLQEVFSKLGPSLYIGRPYCVELLDNQKDWLAPNPDGTGENNLFDRLQPSVSKSPIVPYEWKNDECASVAFTSGSTGMPKGVCHSLGNLSRSAKHLIEHYSIETHDRLLNVAPMFTLSGVIIFLANLMAGCKIVEFPKESTLEEALNTFRGGRPTVVMCGPIFIRQMATLAEKLDDELSSIRVFLSTGAKLDRNTRVLLWDKKCIPVLNCYGSTETLFAIGEHVDHFKPELDIIGRPYPGVTARLVDVQGMSDSVLGLGQIQIHSPNLFLGYLGEPMERKHCFDIGDLGVCDEAGNFSLKGRLDHGVKNSNTSWIFPQALEQLLVNRSDVADAHVRSGYDQYDRGVLHAKVVPSNPKIGSDNWLATLGQEIEDQLGPDYKAAEIEIVKAIPRTALGKIIKDSV